MKIYAIEYQRIDGKLKYFAFTDTFLSTRVGISEDDFFEYKKSFPVSGKNNNSLSGIYFTKDL